MSTVSIRFWLRNGAEKKLTELHEAGKLGAIKVQTDSDTLFPFIDFHYDDNPLLDVFPSGLIRKVTFRTTIDEEKTFVRNGVYKVGHTEIVVQTISGGGSGLNDRDFIYYYQEVKLTGLSWKTSKKSFRKLMTGKLRPFEDWENRRYIPDQRDDGPNF